MFIAFFFFSSRRRHTRFSRDWSSDVCSSDLACPHHVRLYSQPRRRDPGASRYAGAPRDVFEGHCPLSGGYCRRRGVHIYVVLARRPVCARSEERRVGKECRSRWSPDHLKKRKTHVRLCGSSREHIPYFRRTLILPPRVRGAAAVYTLRRDAGWG